MQGYETQYFSYGFLLHSARVATLFYVKSKIEQYERDGDEFKRELWMINARVTAATLIEGNY